MVSLNNLTDQSQFITTGTSGTDFNIVSSGDTHTFNLPIASATNTGKLSSTDWSTFNNKQAALSFTAPLVNTSNTISIPAATSLVDGYLDNLDWTNFNTAYNNMIVSAAVTGTTTKTLTLTQQDAGTITASWTDDNTDAVTSVFGRTGAVVAVSGDYNTSQVTENTNLYFTDARARAALSFTAGSGAYNSTTGVITIPTNNNQITNGSNFITLTSLSAGTGISYNNTTGVITNSAPDQTVSLTAGAGISISGSYPSFTIASTITQYTDALARAAISLTTTGTSGAATYNSTTGVLNIPQYTDQYVGTVTSVGLSSATSGVTIGSTPITTSGTITLAIATASGSQNGLLSSTDWTTFNNKQNALTNPVTGTGTTNYLPKFTGASTIGNSVVYDNGSFVGINTTTNGGILSINGTDPLIGFQNSGSTKWQVGLENTASDRFVWYNNAGAAYRMILTTSGNLGLGVTPTNGTGDVKHIEISSGGRFVAAGNNGEVGTNYYYDSTYKYITTNAVTRLEMNGGVFRFYNAPSGTAGNAISFTQAMTLFANGNLAVGITTDAGYKLDVNGTGRFSGALIVQNSSDTYGFTLAQSNALNAGWGQWADTSGNYKLSRYGGGSYSSPALTISLAGAATFSSSVTAATESNFTGTSVNTRILVTASGVANTVLGFNNSGSTATGVSNNTGYIGVLQGYPLAFITDSVERMRITSGGNVGIGTSSPDTALQAIGGISARTNTTGDAFYRLYLDSSIVGHWYADRAGSKLNIGSVTSIPLVLETGGTERMRITSGGNVLINTTTDAGYELYVNGGSTNGALFYSTSAANQIKAAGTAPAITFTNTITSPTIGGVLGAATTANQFVTGTVAGDVALINQYTGALVFGTVTERMRISSGGNVAIGRTDDRGYRLSVQNVNATPINVNRTQSDGGLIDFEQDGALEGNISVSGNTVSYNSFLGSHWSQLQDGSKTEILKGTILEAIDEMCVWENEQNDRLPKSKISDTINSKNVYGVFLAWDENWKTSNDFYVAAVGLGYIRVNSSQNISMGDLLQSNGDGTAKIQEDDIMRSSTIAKVVSTNKITIYEDGSYLIAATLHCG